MTRLRGSFKEQFGFDPFAADEYEALGVDAFIYYASMGMDMDQQKESLKLFIEKVMPAYA